MNREEQINRASEQYPLLNIGIGSVIKAFKDGAQWADSHPKDSGVEMWIAKDFIGAHLFEERPYKKTMEDIEGKLRTYFHTDTCRSLYIDSDVFPELTFENSPQRVRLTLIKE